MIPKGNGLVEIVGEKQSKERGFFCMDLVGFLTEEVRETGDRSWEFWHSRFEQAKWENARTATNANDTRTPTGSTRAYLIKKSTKNSNKIWKQSHLSYPTIG